MERTVSGLEVPGSPFRTESPAGRECEVQTQEGPLLRLVPEIDRLEGHQTQL